MRIGFRGVGARYHECAKDELAADRAVVVRGAVRSGAIRQVFPDPGCRGPDLSQPGRAGVDRGVDPVADGGVVRRGRRRDCGAQ